MTTCNQCRYLKQGRCEAFGWELKVGWTGDDERAYLTSLKPTTCPGPFVERVETTEEKEESK